MGIPVIYYISPQLWAWRAGRIKLMKRSVDRVLPIFPFEEAIYQRARIDVRFVGHPLIDLAKPRLSREAFLKKLNLDPSKPVLALLPGSRTNELARLAPVIARGGAGDRGAGAGRAVRGRARAESRRRIVRAVWTVAASRCGSPTRRPTMC